MILLMVWVEQGLREYAVRCMKSCVVTPDSIVITWRESVHGSPVTVIKDWKKMEWRG